MSTEIQKAPDMSAIEQVLMAGDLSKLTAPQRVTYYNEVCKSIGVNPLTRPFEYIVLNNKLQLYTRKDCADQLRSIRKVSVKLISKEKVDDIYVVTAHARMPDGREDEATGAVALTNKRGDDLANAIMKAETKAKRRVTLSILGLSFADESEVADLPNARTVTVDMETGEVKDPFVLEEPLPDFEALIAAAETKEQLQTIPALITEAAKSGRVTSDVRKALAEKFKARMQQLSNGAAA